MKTLIRVLFLIVFAFGLVGCIPGGGFIPVAKDRTTTYSVGMEVHGCVVETYVSDNGIDADGNRYSRFGKTFYYPEYNRLFYNPNFGWLSSSVSGVVPIDIVGAKLAALQQLPSGKWQVFQIGLGGKGIATNIISVSKQIAAERGAVYLQTGIDPGDCIRFE